jgi:hypothetical protein
MAFLIDDIFKSLGQKAQLKEQTRAARETEKRQREQWNAKQAKRQSTILGTNDFLKNYNASLRPGAPQYGFDQSTITDIARQLPYGGPATPDLTKGSGWNLAGDAVHGLGQALLTYYMANQGSGNQMQGKSNPLSGTAVPGGDFSAVGDVMPLPQYRSFDELMRR